jgi:Mg2+ and Co2+ transporter CorA
LVRRRATTGRPERAAEQHVRVFLYDAESRDHHLGLDEIDVDELAEHQLLWIDVSELDSLEAAARQVDLAPASVARIADGLTRPELLFHDSYFHLIVVLAERTPLGYEPVALHCVVGENWILTAHRKPTEVLDRFDSPRSTSRREPTA